MLFQVGKYCFVFLSGTCLQGEWIQNSAERKVGYRKDKLTHRHSYQDEQIQIIMCNNRIINNKLNSNFRVYFWCLGKHNLVSMVTP